MQDDTYEIYNKPAELIRVGEYVILYVGGQVIPSRVTGIMEDRGGRLTIHHCTRDGYGEEGRVRSRTVSRTLETDLVMLHYYPGLFDVDYAALREAHNHTPVEVR